MASPFHSEGVFPSSHVKLSHLISVKLDDKNFKQWKQQIDGVNSDTNCVASQKDRL